jgi:hypothetical protein
LSEQGIQPPLTPPVVVVDDQRSVIKPAKVAPRPGPKWETEARERVKAGIRRFAKPLRDLAARDANEGDTRMLVNRILTDVLGFDEFADLTTEYQVRGEFADYGIRIERSTNSGAPAAPPHPSHSQMSSSPIRSSKQSGASCAAAPASASTRPRSPASSKTPCSAPSASTERLAPRFRVSARPRSARGT